MSGGHFDYKQFSLEYLAEEIQELIDNNNIVDDYGYKSDRPEEILVYYRKAIELLKEAKFLAHRIDYLESGDDGEDTFHEYMDEYYIEYKIGDRVKITQLIPPEDLTVNSTGVILGYDDVCDDMLLIKWDDGWNGLYFPKDIEKE